MSTGFPLSQRDSVYQPGATPWGWYVRYGSVLKERRIPMVIPHGPGPSPRGVPSERIHRGISIPRVPAGARMQRPAGVICDSSSPSPTP